MNPDRFASFPVRSGAARHRAESRCARHAPQKMGAVSCSSTPIFDSEPRPRLIGRALRVGW
jgi:hypothetical protein